MSLWFLRPILVLAAAGVLASCASSSSPEARAAFAALRPVNSDEYVIGSGDTLSVFVYQSPELSEPGVAVRPDGKISIPLVQDIQAAGFTPATLARHISDRLKQYVKDPNVTVIVRSFVGPYDRQVKVIGEATQPRAVPYRDGMTLLDLMVDTRGITKYAAGNRAIIVRQDKAGKTHEIHVRLSDLINDGDLSQNVKLEPGDTLIIPQSWF